MKYRTRTYYTDGQKALMWERWKEGWTLHQIAQLFNRAHTSVQGILARTGGIRPAATKPLAMALTLAESEEISRAMAEGQSIRRSPRGSGERHRRSAARSNATVVGRAIGPAKPTGRMGSAHRPKRCKLAENRALASIVTDKLRRLWSPEQIAGWLKHTYPCDESLHVSHETIYRSLFIQARGALKKELLQHLRRTRGMRRLGTTRRRPISTARSLTPCRSASGQRPLRIGPYLVTGKGLAVRRGNSQIATLVERQTRYVMLVKVGKDTQTVVDALIKNARKLPQELYKSLTWDRGKEMAGHKRFTLATDIQVYFCDPQSPWQRGSNENTNGLLRQYLPKGIDISSYSQAKLNAVARQLNERPRKTLGFQTPAEMFSQTVALTG